VIFENFLIRKIRILELCGGDSGWGHECSQRQTVMKIWYVSLLHCIVGSPYVFVLYMMFCFSITEVKLPRQCHSVQNLNVAFLQWPTCNSKLVCTLIAELSNLDDLSTLQPVCLLSVLIIAAKFINRCLDKRLPRVDCSPLTDNLPSRPPPLFDWLYFNPVPTETITVY